MTTPDSPLPPPPPTDEPPPPPGLEIVRIRRFAVVAVLAICVVVAGVVWVRGTWADVDERLASSPEQGVVAHLHRTAEGGTEVLSSCVLPSPPDRVWAVVIDYEHFGDIFSSDLWDMRISGVERTPAGEVRLTGEITSRLRNFPVDARILHRETPEERRASWDEASPPITTNRGRWSIRPIGTKGETTLIVYALEVKVDGTPDFLVNNVLLSQAGTAVEAVRRRLAETGPH
ncbi:MAG: SRPBCC family protein [Planctomycetes bacterium]|nr:SRPBCC family protein [Planctomycetota bacterium]